MNQNSEIKIYINGDTVEFVHLKSNGTLLCKIKNDHCYALSTYVDDQFRGQGIAKKLFLELLDYAKNNHLIIVPECSYIKKQMEQI